MLPDYFRFQLPTRVAYSAGLAQNMGDELAQFGPRRALLVTDEILRGLGMADRITAGLEGTDVQVVAQFTDVPPNSEVRTVEACAAAGTEAGADLILAVGGGSVIDTAKVANILMKKGGRLADHQGAQLVTEPLFPLVVVPTTAGTGSEVTRVAVIADTDQNLKLPFTEDRIQPDLAILDPEVTASMPARVTGATGMDALTHAIESYVSTESSPISDALALQAIRLVVRNIRQAAAWPDDLEARGAMLVASCLAGIAFSHAMVGIVHGIAHALGGVYHVPHGTANGVLLPFGMEHNLAARTARYADIAEAMGVERRGGDALTARLGIRKVRMLIRQLSWLEALPVNLKGAGIDDGLARLDEVVDAAMADGSMLYNPTPVEADAVRRIVERAYRRPAFGVPVSRWALRRSATAERRAQIEHAFATTEELYDVLGGFMLSLKEHPEIGPSVQNSNLRIRFHYRDPEATITIDASGPEVHYDLGPSEVVPEVEMTMQADFAHAFWQGRANVVRALARGQVTSRGAVHKAVKLLPILRPAFALYPTYLEEQGLGRLVA